MSKGKRRSAEKERKDTHLLGKKNNEHHGRTSVGLISSQEERAHTL
jgi:hypothetical protein